MKKYNSIFAAKEEKPAKQPKPKTDKKTKKKDKKQEEPVKKRGRPSKIEVEQREKEKLDAEIAFRKELIERQKAAASGSIPVETTECKSDFSYKTEKDPNWIPPWPVFLPGQRVEYIVPKKDGKTYKGTIVGIDNIHSAFVRVSWDDGSSQYHAKLALKLLEKKTYKSLLKRKETNK